MNTIKNNAQTENHSPDSDFHTANHSSDSIIPTEDHSHDDDNHFRPASATPPARRFKTGDVILKRYEVQSEIGQGGMGVVYRCRDTVGNVDVAVKGLPPEVSHNPSAMEEVRDNYTLVTKLSHPNIAACKTLERDESTGDYYLVMEYVEGENLRQWMRRMRREKKMTLDVALPILRQVAEALDAAHRQGVIHRDIKPDNVKFAADGTVKVLDFGLAAQVRSSMAHFSNRTVAGAGTNLYKSPEQWRASLQQGEAADQYSLAVTAYEMLSGHAPFESDSMEVLERAVVERPRPVERLEGLPAYANAALVAGLAKEAADRYASCVDFVRALGGEKVRPGRGTPKGNGRPWLAVAAVVAIIAGLGYYLLNSGTEEPIVAPPSGIGAVGSGQKPEDAKKVVEPSENSDVVEAEKAAEPLVDMVAQTERESKLAEETDRLAKQKKVEDEARQKAESDLATAAKARREAEAKAAAEKKAAEEARKEAEKMERERKAAEDARLAAEAKAAAEKKAAEDARKEAEEMERKRKAAEDARLAAERKSTAGNTLQVAEEDKTVEFNGIVTLPGGVELKMVKVEPGSFTNTDIKKKFTLTREYWMGVTEVTQAQWNAVGTYKKDKNSFTGDKLPVENVSWDEAGSFCHDLNRLCKDQLPKGFKFDLPTEAQWEYAARGGRKSEGYEYSGGKYLGAVGWYEENSGNKTHPVGDRYPNELGLYDMSGNVWEWCRDWYDSSWSHNSETLEGMKDGSRRVVRGGSWGCSATGCRSSIRFSNEPAIRYYDLGFRVALVPVQ
ncbi:MAG: SUMF1/EgtB/PvdO family nonheme iron enzyme [Lentisphaeria bacterium]|nr:SUMF1/EgtB/PvdO family nonheme iron enzyme [Lentisphaeria bacterium]